MRRSRIPWRRLLAFGRASSGNFATLTALTMPVALAIAAFAIDEGLLYQQRRDLQTLADLAAIAAAADTGNAEATVMRVLRDNVRSGGLPDREPLATADGSGCGAIVTTGVYLAEPSIDPVERFQADENPVNAVRISICEPGARYFSASFFDAPPIRASAVAATRDEAAFSIGSRLARIDGGIANAVLGALTGSRISLSAMDYEALLSSDVRLLALLDALDSQLALRAVDYSDVLQANATVGEIAAAIATAGGIGAGAKAAAGKLAARLDGAGREIPLSQLFDVGSLALLPTGVSSNGNDPAIGALELLSAAAVLAAADGERQVGLDLGTSVTGLAKVELALAIGEPAQSAYWFSIGEAGAIASTAQTRLMLTAQIGDGLLPGRIRLPLYVEIAHASARLDGIACATRPDRSPRVTIAARPGVVRMVIGEMDKSALGRFERAPAFAPARLLSIPLARVTGRAEIEVADSDETLLQFSPSEVGGETVKRVSARDFAASLTRSLLAELKLEAEIAGFSLTTPQALTEAVADALGQAAPAIDEVLLSTLRMLGLSVGEADVRVHSARCGAAVLVQ